MKFFFLFTVFFFSSTLLVVIAQNDRHRINGNSTISSVTFTQTENNLGIIDTNGFMGFAWGDYDNDGDLDLFHSGAEYLSILYRNENGNHFTDVSALGVLLDNSNFSTGAIWADFDKDGDLDILFTNSGLSLYINDGSTFTDISIESGLNTVDEGESLMGLAVCDFDRDGDLDIAFSGGLDSPLPVRLLKNTSGVFTNVASSQISDSIPVLESWDPQWVDVDNDGDLDLWMPTIRTPNQGCVLFINQNSELILSNPSVSGLTAKGAIASSWGDYDNDGDLDLVIAPWNDTNPEPIKMYRNNGNGTYTDIAHDLGLDSVYTDSRSICWGDYDNDGDLDLLIGRWLNPSPKLYRNDILGTNRTFTEVGVETGAGNTDGYFRSVAFVDYDNDGFLDLFYAGHHQQCALLHNSGNSNHWIGIRPKGVFSNTAGIGARVRIVAGSLKQIRDIQGGASGMTNGNLWAHFGLGAVTKIDSLIVYWPSGNIYTDIDVGADKYYTIEEGSAPSHIKIAMNCNFGDATKTNSYQIIGIPGVNDLPISDLISGTEGKQGDWRAFHDPGSGDYLEYDGTSVFNFTPGKAFWVVSKNTINLNDTVTSVPLSVDNSYSISLHSGWNLISNPFDKTISWSSVQNANGVTQPIHFYQSGSYNNPTDLETYKGYYFYSAGAASLKIPYISGAGSISKQNAQTANEIELILVLRGMKKSIVKVGFSEEANSGMDKLDIFSPPSQFCEINMSLYNEEIQQNYKFLQEEYRQDIGRGQEYRVFIKNTSNETLDLINKGLEYFSDYKVYLLDKSLMKFYNLKNQNSIKIKSSQVKKEYQLFIGTEDYIIEKKKEILPSEYTLYQNYPNPFNPETTIKFALPQQSRISLMIYNVLGKLISELIKDELLEAGYHEVIFKNNSLASGVYIYELTAGDFSCIKKMLMIK